MTRYALLLLAAALSGCYRAYPIRIRYEKLPPNLKVIVAQPWQVNRHCHHFATTLDNGARVTSSTQLKCCYDVLKKTAIVSEGGEDCLAHEFCHADKPDDPAWCEKNVPGSFP